MTQKRKADQTKVIAAAALSHADKVGWGAVTLKDVAKKARLPEETVRRHFPDAFSILEHVLHTLDEETERTAASDGPWRDNLFDVLMTRFELIEKHRPGFASIPGAMAANPQKAAKLARPFCRSMQRMLKHAGAPADPLRAAVFGGLYLTLIDAWKKDETPDLAKTMAAVDKRLGYLENLCGVMPPSPSGRRPE